MVQNRQHHSYAQLYNTITNTVRNSISAKNSYTISYSQYSKSTNSNRLYFFKGKAASTAPKGPVPTKEEQALAYQYWTKSCGFMKSTAPNYLTAEQCNKKFSSLVKSVGTVSGALQIVQTDPLVLSFSEKRIEESYVAWKVKLSKDDDSNNDEEVLQLCIRNPSILSLSAKAIENANSGDVIQTYFWSYFAVVFRPLSNALQTYVIRPLFFR